MISWLSGCEQQLEQILDVVNQLLAGDSDTEQVADSDGAEEKAGQETEADQIDETDEADKAESDGTDDGDETSLAAFPYQSIVGDFTMLTMADKPIDDRLREQGYEIYRDPQGMPLPIPYNWVLVSNQSEEGKFTGLYCFDIPQDISVFANHFDHYYLDQKVQHDANPADDNLAHVTTIDVDRDGLSWHVGIYYVLDEHDNTCAHVEIEYDSSPDFLIEPAEEVKPLDSSRDRKLPDNYDDLLQQASSEDNFYFRASPNSVKEAIYNDEATMLIWLAREVPNIYLYDSYLIRQTALDDGSGWDGLLCTDVPINMALDKHLELLENYNANINHFEVIDPADNTSMLRVAAMVDFSFNDEYGTGSWNGSSYFYRYEDDDTPFSEQQCMATELQFSTELVK